MPLVVMKFGGASVADAQRMLAVADTVGAARTHHRVVVVVSAMAKVTDLLMAISAEAQNGSRTQVRAYLTRLIEIHQQAAHELKLDALAQRGLSAIIDKRLSELDHLLLSITVLGELTPRALDLISSYGERLSIHLVSAALRRRGIDAEPVEATKLILTTQRPIVMPLMPESEAKAKPALAKLLEAGTVPVITGFIGATTEGVLTTLGRGGSDYSATILAYCLDADEVDIFTDSDGVLSADPRLVPGARALTALSYNEAAELSFFGAKVLHPLALTPVARRRIPVYIKNAFNPSAPGTKITGASGGGKGPKAVTAFGGVALVTVEGRGLVGLPGVAAKVFTAIAAAQIDVLLIAQASSGYNISFVVPGADAQRAVKLLKQAFQPELATGNLEEISANSELAIIAVVGEGMHGKPSVAATAFEALGKAGINVVAIAQGSSERNISLIVQSGDAAKAVACIHNAFGLSA
jgi:aspartate kinase